MACRMFDGNIILVAALGFVKSRLQMRRPLSLNLSLMVYVCRRIFYKN